MGGVPRFSVVLAWGSPGPRVLGSVGVGGWLVLIFCILSLLHSHYWFFMASLNNSLVPQTWPQIRVRECTGGVIREAFLEEAIGGGQGSWREVGGEESPSAVRSL